MSKGNEGQETFKAKWDRFYFNNETKLLAWSDHDSVPVIVKIPSHADLLLPRNKKTKKKLGRFVGIQDNSPASLSFMRDRMLDARKRQQIGIIHRLRVALGPIDPKTGVIESVEPEPTMTTESAMNKLRVLHVHDLTKQMDGALQAFLGLHNTIASNFEGDPVNFTEFLFEHLPGLGAIRFRVGGEQMEAMGSGPTGAPYAMILRDASKQITGVNHLVSFRGEREIEWSIGT